MVDHPSRPARSRAVGFLLCALAYGLALALAILTARATRGGPLAKAAAAELVATAAVFVASVLARNSSMYDPYWSVAPPLLGLGWVAGASTDAVGMRQCVVLVLVTAWSLRLTWNWARGWRGLDHEDWRYVQLHRRLGRAFWPVSFLGIHLMPTVVVFLGSLPMYRALGVPARGLSALDIVAAVITLAAVSIESVADAQLRRFGLRESARAGAGHRGVIQEGLWAWSRHPNYFGEVLFWWGIFLFGVAASPAWWMATGPLVMTGLFVFISIPMMERHLLERRPAFAEVRRRIPALVPWFPRHGGR